MRNIRLPAVESDVPVPPTQKCTATWQAVYARMAIGDSFEVPKSWSINGSRKSAKLAGIKIIQRKISRRPVRYRIWRVA